MYTIRLKRSNHSLKLKRVVTPIRVKHLSSPINIRHTGARGLQGLEGPQGQQGLQGLQGEPGVGVPTGGSTAQILAKASEQDYDTQWVTLQGLDKTYVQPFTVSDTVIVTHNLNKYPAVTVLDSADEEVEGQVDYLNTNQLIVGFAFPFSGRIVCN